MALTIGQINDTWTAGTMEPVTENETFASMASPGRSLSANAIAKIFLYAVWIFLIVGGNVFFSVIMLRKKEMRQSMANVYIVSILLARASIGCFVVPARITGMFSERYLTVWMCKLCHMAALGSSATSAFCMAATALMQYKVVQGPAAMTTQKVRTHIVYLALLWLGGFTYGLRALFSNDIIMVPTESSFMWSCTITPEYSDLEKGFVVIDFICLWFLPSVIVSTCYYKLGKIITKNLDEKSSAIAASTHQRSMKTIRMLLVMVIFFIVCNMTTYIMGIYTLWKAVWPDDIKSYSLGIYMFAYANAWAHLLILVALRKDIKDELFRVICFMGRGKGPCMCYGTVEPRSESNINQSGRTTADNTSQQN